MSPGPGSAGEPADPVPLAEGELLDLEGSCHGVHGNAVQVRGSPLPAHAEGAALGPELRLYSSVVGVDR
ncbi:hypothetical protein QFZ82_000930 [Streptomyces sp. V4I23]|uniref:hypothetical protein n=1 Tax=Streptomyces sp. V4I23 TaxID=3042282 RepID=UPI0027881A11|nr:hypothetical protein [Streptomyces sp. V4I23]MDQ1006445.1 hypothetical protein [Streptomyces sp. V4I23]